MEVVAGDADRGELCVSHLDSLFVLSVIDFSAHLQSFAGSGGGDQVDDDLMVSSALQVATRASPHLGASSLVGLPAKAAAEPPPEVRKIRLVHTPAICLSPQYIAEKFLHGEGFTDVE